MSGEERYEAGEVGRGHTGSPSSLGWRAIEVPDGKGAGLGRRGESRRD